MSFKHHIGQIIKTSYCHFRNETILCLYLSLSVYEKLAQGFISKLDNYNALLTGLPSGLITKLEQNSFVREVYLAKKKTAYLPNPSIAALATQKQRIDCEVDLSAPSWSRSSIYLLI